MRATLSFAAGAFLLVAGAGCDQGQDAYAKQAVTGAGSYKTNCAVCHGDDGRGDGPAAFLLDPRPRDFRRGSFRLVSTQNGVASENDLFATITQGMPGTAMPSWEHLPEGERRELARHVLSLRHDQLVKDALARGLAEDEAQKKATGKTTPGALIDVPPAPPVTDAAALKASFVAKCATCHAEDGTGRDDPKWRTAEGFPIRSRNFVKGVFKGGRDDLSLYRRIAAGLPGTPMPGFGTLPPAEIWNMVRYIQSLSDPAAQERAWSKPGVLRAARLGVVPKDASDGAWDAIAGTPVTLMPLWTSAGSVDQVVARAAWDDGEIAFLLEWSDEAKDLGVTPASFPDAAAVQLSGDANPPFFGMGDPDRPCQIWHWKALWGEDQAGFVDGELVARSAIDLYVDDDATRAAGAMAGNPLSRRDRGDRAEELFAVRFGALTAAPPAEQGVTASAAWREGRWRVLFRHARAGKHAGDVKLGPGATSSVAFAVWNGAVAERNGQKAVSVWQRLELAP